MFKSKTQMVIYIIIFCLLIYAFIYLGKKEYKVKHILVKEEADIKKVVAELKTKTFDEVDFDDYIGLFITGGRSPEYIRMDHKVISLVKCFVRSGKPVAAICHAAQVLTAADVVCGRKLTCDPALAAEVKLAGGNYIEVAPDEAVVDCNLITSPAWPGNTAILREFAKALGCEFIFRP